MDENEFQLLVPTERIDNWCICGYKGECMACRIESKVYEFYGRLGLEFLRNKLRIARGSASATKPVKVLLTDENLSGVMND